MSLILDMLAMDVEYDAETLLRSTMKGESNFTCFLRFSLCSYLLDFAFFCLHDDVGFVIVAFLFCPEEEDFVDTSSSFSMMGLMEDWMGLPELRPFAIGLLCGPCLLKDSMLREL